MKKIANVIIDEIAIIFLILAFSLSFWTGLTDDKSNNE
jgi:hypothetical protein